MPEAFEKIQISDDQGVLLIIAGLFALMGLIHWLTKKK